MTEQKPAPTSETIAEGVHAFLALIAVVLLARAQSGAFDRTPSAWSVLVVSLLTWTAAAWATHSSPPSRHAWLTSWRSCVCPMLISLIVGGRGSVPLLLLELVISALGVSAIGYLAYRGMEQATCSTTTRPPAPQVEMLAPTPAPVLTPLPEPVSCSESTEEEEFEPHAPSESTQRLDPAHDATLRHLEVPRSSSEETPETEESLETESWTRREFDGEISIEAVVLARFAAGSKLAVLHLPFVPPLPEVPQIECEPLDSGCDVTISIESAFRHGAKLNVTRRSAGSAESVPIGIVFYTSVEEEIESSMKPH